MRSCHPAQMLFPRILALFFVFVGILTPIASAQERAEQRGFVDNFAILDEERWRVADGWSNGEWTANDWRRSQIRRTPEGLEITLARSRGGDKRYSSGEIQSDMGFQYGYFEVRMRVPRGSGLVTGFFTYTRDGAESTWDEIDVEILGRNTRAVQFGYFGGGQNHVTTVPLGFDAADGFHTYGFEWARGYLRWYVDGRLLHEERGARGPLPQSSQRLYLHLWNSETLTDWLGPILPWEGPWRASVSCVAYAPAYRGASLCAGG